MRPNALGVSGQLEQAQRSANSREKERDRRSFLQIGVSSSATFAVDFPARFARTALEFTCCDRWFPKATSRNRYEIDRTVMLGREHSNRQDAG